MNPLSVLRGEIVPRFIILRVLITFVTVQVSRCDISELKAEMKAINKRIDDNDQLTNGIHELATNVATMSLEIKMLTEKFDSSITRIENGLQKQSDRISVIENAPSQKWDKFVWLIIAAAVSALVSFIAGGLL